MMKKINRLDITVAILAGLACLFMYLPLNFPVWALFIGWAWYFAEGAQPVAFKRAIPPMLFGYASAAISVLVFAALGFKIPILALIVAITVLAMMIATKSSIFAMSLASFNGFSSMFAGYYAGSFPAVADGGAVDWKNVLIAVGWIALANVVGLCFGWLSVKIGVKK